MRAAALLALAVALGTRSAAARPFERMFGDKIATRSLPSRFGGVNLAGCDFGMSTDGTSGTSECPGTDQISHFVNEGANVIRLPVGWQYLVGSTSDSSSTTLDATFFATYNSLVTSVTDSGAYAIIDVHNYARWNGEIIGQSGPSNDDFAALWTLLATEYKSNPLVMFELVNEPHDLDVTLWAGTVQAAIDAIRAAGATSQTILIPGTEYTHLDAWTDGSDDALLNVTDPNNNNLLVGHIYLDSDGSGTSTECTTTGTDTIDAWTSFLEQNGRKGIITETGGGNTDSCVTDLSAALDDVVSSSDTIAGFVIWAAGSFDTSYALSVTPNSDGTDQLIWSEAVEQYLPGASGNATATSSVVSATTIAASSLAPSSALSTNSVATSNISSSAASVGGNTEIVSTSATSASAPSSAAPSSAVPSMGFTSGVTFPASASASASAWPSSALASSVIPISTASTVSSMSSAPSSTSSASSTSGTNLQTYTGALGGIVAPAVYASGTVYVSSNQTYNFAIDALDASCYAQMNDCQAAANAGGNQGNLTVSACESQQVQECLAAASATASS